MNELGSAFEGLGFDLLGLDKIIYFGPGPDPGTQPTDPCTGGQCNGGCTNGCSSCKPGCFQGPG